MRGKISIIGFLMCTISIMAVGQDPGFSQYHAAPLYLNPGFAGTVNNYRLIMNTKKQWPSYANGYTTSAVSFDYRAPHLNSGFGLLFLSDRAGTAGYGVTHVEGIYAYKILLPKQWVISSGLSFGYWNKGIDASKLVFGDQLSFSDDGSAPSIDPTFNTLRNAQFFDFSWGAVLYNKKFWGGLTIKHLNRPNHSVLNDNPDMLPVYYSLHAGVRFSLYNGMRKKDVEPVLAPSFILRGQSGFDQLDLGFKYLYDPIVIGFWYRGIPIQKNISSEQLNHDAVVALLGLQLKSFEFAYSYDITISGLGAASGGAHEISLMYQFSIYTRDRVRRKDKFVPCPTMLKQSR